MAKKVLVIEDSCLTCHILDVELRQNGFEVIITRDGKDGLMKARELSPDIILLDLVLPDIPGEEVCRELRKYAGTEHIPIIMLTGKSTEADRVIGKVLGAQAYMAKPFEIGVLMAEIYKWIAACALFFCVCGGSPRALAADGNETRQAPSGMEILKVGEHTVYVAQGTKVTQRGSQLILEPPDEFVARKIIVLEEELNALKLRDLEISSQIEDLKKAVERVTPLKSAEAVNGTK
ncbi:MAG: response regulator [Candidatus Omnitrophota bacterium]